MPEDDPVAVAHVLNLACAGKVDFNLAGQCRIQSNDKTAPPVQVGIAMDTYRLAKKYQIEPLQNLMVDQLVSCYKVMKPSVAAFRRTLEVTEEGDGLREFVMLLFSHRVEAKGGWEAIKASQHKYYTDFALRDIESMEFALESLLKYHGGRQGLWTMFHVVDGDWHSHVDTARHLPGCKATEQGGRM